MQLVTPKVVRIAVRMATIVWMMNFQVSFFMVFCFIGSTILVLQQ